MMAQKTALVLTVVVVLQLALVGLTRPRQGPEQRPRQATARRSVSSLVDRIAGSGPGLTGAYPVTSPPSRRPPSSPTRGDGTLRARIEREAETFSLDPVLVELVVKHESAYDPLAVSPAGATGLMQLMPGTAAEMAVYDPFDPDQNLAGGSRYLALLLGRFGDLRLALAAYNAGPEAVEWWGGVPPYPETQRYVDTLVSEYELIRGPGAQGWLSGP